MPVIDGSLYGSIYTITIVANEKPPANEVDYVAFRALGPNLASCTLCGPSPSRAAPTGAVMGGTTGATAGSASSKSSGTSISGVLSAFLVRGVEAIGNMGESMVDAAVGRFQTLVSDPFTALQMLNNPSEFAFNESVNMIVNTGIGLGQSAAKLYIAGSSGDWENFFGTLGEVAAPWLVVAAFGKLGGGRAAQAEVAEGEAAAGASAVGRPITTGPKPVRRIYEGNPKHRAEPYTDSRGRIVSRAPHGDCQAMLDCSVQPRPNSPQRIGVEPTTGLRVIFNRHLVQEFAAEIREFFHGFVPEE